MSTDTDPITCFGNLYPKTYSASQDRCSFHTPEPGRALEKETQCKSSFVLEKFASKQLTGRNVITFQHSISSHNKGFPWTFYNL